MRYPETAKLELPSFASCGLDEVLPNDTNEAYFLIWQSLSKAARQKIEEECFSEGRILWLFADVSSMMLKPTSRNEPFTPSMVMDDKRSAIPEDLDDEEIQFLKEIAPQIKNPYLRARVSDLLWLLLKPKDPNFAIAAIDNYKLTPITTDIWSQDGRDCWDRAIQLCLLLKAGAGNRYQVLETLLLDTLHSEGYESGYLVYWISEMLFNHGLAKSQYPVIADKLSDFAEYFLTQGSFNKAHDYFNLSSEIYKKTSQQDKSHEMIVKSAETFVSQAQARLLSNDPSNLVAAKFYEDAIHKYRTIPKKLRSQYNIEEKILDLRSKMNKASEMSLEEMGVASSGPIDISEIIDHARNAVKGKSVLDALLSFCNISKGASRDSIVKKLMRDHPFQSLVGATHISKDGRVIAKRLPAGFNNLDDPAILLPEMIKHYTMQISLVVQGSIVPALETMQLEHRLKEIDFYQLTLNSPIIPSNRKRLVAKGLYAGYDNDFVTALHILVPQIENLVRVLLKEHNVKTTNLNTDGIEQENGLSTLIEKPEVSTIFGQDLAFELEALFCSPFGPNLRNELAHGLLDYEESQSIASIYAWWLSLKLVFNTYWNAIKEKKSEVDPSS